MLRNIVWKKDNLVIITLKLLQYLKKNQRLYNSILYIFIELSYDFLQMNSMSENKLKNLYNLLVD